MHKEAHKSSHLKNFEISFFFKTKHFQIFVNSWENNKN